MGVAELPMLIRQLRRMVSGAEAHGLADAELLRRFTATRDEAAFEALVWRHAPMVLGLCRRLLRHEQDAEDAFQAVFLILARKAGGIGKGQSVGSWLYKVAYRVALRARQQQGRRPIQDSEAERTARLASSVPDDTLRVVDEELHRLPEKYRAPILLCCLEGKTNAEAAQELNCPKGTLLSRLSRGRELLRRRLARRDVMLSTGLLTGLLATPAAEAAPAGLVVSTAHAAAEIAAGSAAAGLVSGRVAALTEGVLTTMTLGKCKLAGLALFAAVVLAGAALALAPRGPLGSAAYGFADPKAANQGPKPDPKKPDDRAAILGTWEVVSVLVKGEAPKNQNFEAGKFIITKDRLYAKQRDLVQGAARYALRPDLKPRGLDVTPDPEGVSPKMEGIYELDGDKLRLCFAKPGEARPKGFANAAESEVILITLKRGPAEKIDEEELKKLGQLKTGQTLSANNLRRIGAAMHNYHTTHNSYPNTICDKNGKPLLSWRVALLPFLAEADLHGQFRLDEPWDSEHNKKLLAKMPAVFASTGEKPKEKHETYYRVFAGKDTVFEPNQEIKLTDITDGTSNTITVVEAGEAVSWTRPDELLYDADKPLPKLGGMFKDGLHIVLADGSVHFISTKFNEKILRAMLTRSGGEVVNQDELDK